MEHVYNQMYQKMIPHWNNSNNPGHNEIALKYGELRDDVCLKPLNRFFYEKSLCVIIRAYKLFLRVK